jgi:hypothetical protein
VPDSPRHYSFHPLERRGVLLGLSMAQVLTLMAGALAAAIVGHALSGPAAPAAVVAILAGSATGALWPAGGRPIVAWVPAGAGWLAHRATRTATSEEPRSGYRSGTVEGAFCRSVGSRRERPILRPPGIDLMEIPAGPGQAALGVIRDRRAGTWAAVVPVGGRAFALLDPPEQVQRLEAWRAVLGALARPGSPLCRVQWVERSSPWGPAETTGALPGSGALDPVTSLAHDSYVDLVTAATPTTRVHEVWLVLAVGSHRRPGQAHSTPVEVLRRELRLLDGQLRGADLRPGPPLGPNDLAGVLRMPHLPAGALSARPRPASRAWAMAAEETWSAFHADDGWHATYWIADWPRVEVSPDFLAPMLVSTGRRSVAVVMAPVPADRAMRQTRSARTADVADAELRHRAGFLPSERREREAEGVIRREGELADGHAEYRFSGYVTVSASDRASLDAGCAEVEHAAQAARLDLRRLYGRQSEAFTWTLPLARGLA